MHPPPDAIAATTHPDPWPYYAALRQSRPLFFDHGLRLWVASSAAVVEAALVHPHLRVRPPAEPVPKALLGSPTGEVFAQLVRMNDGGFHREHRPATERAAAAFSLEVLGTQTALAAADLAGRVDVNAWLSAVPVQAIARMLRVPADQLDTTVAHVHAFTQGIAAGADAATLAAADKAATALMAQGAAEGLDRVRSANRIAMMQQSLDATAGLIGNAIARWQREARVPDLAFVEEIACWDPPTHHTRRFAAGDTELAGQALAAGDGVLVLLAAANHDPAARRSFAFGAGAHGCPGERIAVTIAAAALKSLHESDGLRRFGAVKGYRPLPNVRIPVFAT
ncbi:cytochrome P450 [Caenimonas sedimenti]|uniref:Cytochrome P450 n=1 Tax=Caenimonas sedimenti TaxID=2596921 RepID=A0A562ZTH4_9BURK|nr:cytochrome P450 [Caenimonas sedimenti]TWO71585.1 cytochrome P450 [Caenimonas sedimenti]